MPFQAQIEAIEIPITILNWILALLPIVVLLVLLAVFRWRAPEAGPIGMFAAAIIAIIPAVNFSGLIVPVSSLSGSGRLLGLAFPSSWYQQVSVGTFTKGLGFAELWHNHLALAGFALFFTVLSIAILDKQET